MVMGPKKRYALEWDLCATLMTWTRKKHILFPARFRALFFELLLIRRFRGKESVLHKFDMNLMKLLFTYIFAAGGGQIVLFGQRKMIELIVDRNIRLARGEVFEQPNLTDGLVFQESMYEIKENADEIKVQFADKDVVYEPDAYEPFTFGE
jgi:hypothetical protein